MACEVVLVHSSDLHIDEDRAAGSRGFGGTAGLRLVLLTAQAVRADVVLLAGDTFENNQLGSAILDRAGRLLAEAGIPVVILPGNHDPALDDSVFVRGGFGRIPNLSILGVTHDEAVPFPVFDLEIWGTPIATTSAWPPCAAHGSARPAGRWRSRTGITSRPKPAPTRCGRPGSLATRRSQSPAPTISRSAIGTGRCGSAMVSFRPITRARRNLPGQSISCG